METKEDWWNLLENNWKYLTEDLPDALNIMLGTAATSDHTHDGTPLGITCFEDLEQAKTNMNWQRITSYLNAFWIHAPDEQWIHTIPGWGALCELCSEVWVFEEDEKI